MIGWLLGKSPGKRSIKRSIHDKLKTLFQHDTERTLNICFLWKTKPALNVLLLSAFPISLFYAQRTLRDTLDSTSPNCFQFEDGLARHQTNRLVGYTLVRWVTVRVSAATKRQTSLIFVVLTELKTDRQKQYYPHYPPKGEHVGLLGKMSVRQEKISAKWLLQNDRWLGENSAPTKITVSKMIGGEKKSIFFRAKWLVILVGNDCSLAPLR